MAISRIKEPFKLITEDIKFTYVNYGLWTANTSDVGRILRINASDYRIVSIDANYCRIEKLN